MNNFNVGMLQKMAEEGVRFGDELPIERTPEHVEKLNNYNTAFNNFLSNEHGPETPDHWKRLYEIFQDEQNYRLALDVIRENPWLAKDRRFMRQLME